MQRIAGGQAVQGVGHGSLVAGLRRVGKGDGAGTRASGHLLAAKLHHHVLGVVAQGGVQIGVVGRYVAELPIDRARAKNGVLLLRLEPAVRPDVNRRSRQIRRTADHHTAACRRLRIGRHLVDGTRRERQVSGHVQRAADFARGQSGAALQCGRANLAHAVQGGAAGHVQGAAQSAVHRQGAAQNVGLPAESA
ncbi:hypothetical protein D3C72_1447990 [compost metagenome]